jgi:hypothetical protein
MILDTSLLVAEERGKFDMVGFLQQFSSAQPLIAAITASELLHGVERAHEPVRKAARQRHVEQIAFLIGPRALQTSLTWLVSHIQISSRIHDVAVRSEDHIVPMRIPCQGWHCASRQSESA